MTAIAVRTALNRLCAGGWLVSVPIADTRENYRQADNLYVLNPDGWLDMCSKAEEIVERVEARMNAYLGRDGNSPFPRWGVLFTGGRNGLRVRKS